mmetsp:Transcript_36130/g.81752  ORF Transcript_36130/g.81752 Transcript_36130/m.81752 type:complete len:589 (+) Transcript_36130:69-1835(+)
MEVSSVSEHGDGAADLPDPVAAVPCAAPAPAPQTTISGWVRRRPSSKWSRTFGALPRRHLTIDYKIRSLYYSHTEDGKEVSIPLKFSELLSVQALEVTHKSICLWPQGAEVLHGFTLQTKRDVLELLCPSQEESDMWVRVLWHTIKSELALQGQSESPGSPPSKPVASFEQRSVKTPPPEMQEPSSRGRDPSARDLHKSSQESPNAEERQGGMLPGPPGPQRDCRSRSPTTQGNKMDVLDEVKSAEDPTADAKLTDAHVAEPVKLTLEGTSSCEEGGLDTSQEELPLGVQHYDSDSEGSEPPVALADVLLPKYVEDESLETPKAAASNEHDIDATAIAVEHSQADPAQDLQQEGAINGLKPESAQAGTGVTEEVQFDALDAISVTSAVFEEPAQSTSAPSVENHAGLRYMGETEATERASEEGEEVSAQAHQALVASVIEAKLVEEPQKTLHEETDRAEHSTASATPATVESQSPQPEAEDSSAAAAAQPDSPLTQEEREDLNVGAAGVLVPKSAVDAKLEDDVQSFSSINSKSHNSESGESSVAGGRHGLSTPDRLLADVSSKPPHHGAKSGFNPPSRLAVVRDDAE